MIYLVINTIRVIKLKSWRVIEFKGFASLEGFKRFKGFALLERLESLRVKELES